MCVVKKPREVSFSKRGERFSGHEFEQALGDGDGQGSLVCCIPWGYNESDRTERLNSNNLCSLI